jgi:hypothetical protein
MIASHIHDALEQVRRLQAFVLERNRFKGYSGQARLASGLIALVGAVVLSAPQVPATPAAHLLGWGLIVASGLVANYSALLYWFLFDAEVRRSPAMLKPALDALPPLAVGGLLATALVLRGEYDLLFGACLSLYGLAQVAYRRSLPHGIYLLGFYYLAGGAILLLAPGVRFTNPWPMALAFSVGELASGTVLIMDHRRHRALNEEDLP